MTVATRTAGDVLALHQETIREILPNGLTLLVRRDTTAPVVAIVTHVKAGYFDETDDIVGIAHVLEHMYFKGTPSRGVGEIARETKAAGGYLNAHTIYDHTSYFTVLPSASFERGLDIQFDAYANSLIDQDELARELEVIIQEEKRKRDTPTAIAIESLYALLHDRHRIRRWRIGEEHALRAFTRDQLITFYRYWYRPGNTILSIVGDVDPDVVRREVLVRYGALLSGDPVRTPGPREIAEPGFRVREWSGDIAQHQIAFGWRAPSLEHLDSAALDLASIALGSGRASRLYRAVRERQLASGISAWNYTAGDVGVFVVHAEAPAAQAREAAMQTWRETMAARDRGFRTRELVRAQRIIESRWLRRLETMDGQATYLATWEAEGGLDLATTYYDRMLSLNNDAVQGALHRHLDPRQASVISYRPEDTEALAESSELVDTLLRSMEGNGSSVLPPPDAATPVVNDAIEAPAVHVGVAREEIAHGVHVYRTSHGIPVLVARRRGAPLVNIGVFQRGGASAESAPVEGLARLAAHSTLKGTERRTGTRIAEAVEELGSSIGVGTGMDSLSWTLSVPVRHFTTATEILADVVQRPTFPDDAVETERRLALAEVTRLRDDMYRWPMRLANGAAYGAHPYGRTVIGSDESLARLDAARARDFHVTQVVHGATVLAVVGDVDEDDAAAMLARDFAQLRWREDVSPPEIVWPSHVNTAEDSRDKKQTALAMLFESAARNDDARFAARVLSAVASGLGGRFFEQLRDKQSLAYTVMASPVERRAGGAFAAYIATSPAREEEARAGLLAEFARFFDEAPTHEELERARHYLIGTHAIAQQSGASVMADIVDAWMFGGLHELDEFVTQVERVTPEHVLRFARTFFDASRRAEGIVRGVME